MLGELGDKKIFIYIGIGLVIYFLFFNKAEGFGTINKVSHCKYLKDKQKEIKNFVTKKCNNMDVGGDSRSNINQRTECYNYVGDQIVTDLDASSWCDLDAKDLALIDEAAKTLEADSGVVPDAYENDGSYAEF
jgi:hypothetical protein